MTTVSQLIRFLTKQDPNRIVLIKENYDYGFVNTTDPKLVYWDDLSEDIVEDISNRADKNDFTPAIILYAEGTDDY